MKALMTFCSTTIKHFKHLVNKDGCKNILIGVKGRWVQWIKILHRSIAQRT